MKKCFLIFLFALISVNLFAQSEKRDSIEISLLTCNPGNEIYSLFGHTAIRYQNFDKNIDLVYNYGMFSFKTPNFVMRFVKGETDYELGVIPFYYFESEYAMRGSSVYQQNLNLTYDEKDRLKTLLDENYEPNNRVYRYNYFYDNCTTRARDKIEESINGKVIYTESNTKESFRSIIHKFTKNNEWDQFGIDLCLGSEADRDISDREKMFSPFYLLDAMKSAKISTGNSIRTLVKSEKYIVEVEPEVAEKGFPLSPFATACLLLILCISVAYFEVRHNKIYWGWDIFMFSAQGVAGCIVAFLFFFSVHPTVDSNWILILFNPIPLLYLPFMIRNVVKKKKDLFHYINIAYLTLFILIMSFISQKFDLTILPLTASLLVCSLGHILCYRKRFK